MGMDWHDLATELSQICPKNLVINLEHMQGYAGILCSASLGYAVLPFPMKFRPSYLGRTVEDRTENSVPITSSQVDFPNLSGSLFLPDPPLGIWQIGLSTLLTIPAADLFVAIGN